MSIQTVNYDDWELAISAAKRFLVKAEIALRDTKAEDRDWERYNAEFDAWRVKDTLDGRPAPQIYLQAQIYRASAKRASMDLTRSLVAIRRPR